MKDYSKSVLLMLTEFQNDLANVREESTYYIYSQIRFIDLVK